jgi:hypothetical protein
MRASGLAILCALGAAGACGGSGGNPIDGADGSNPFGANFGDSGGAQACTNLCLKQVTCSGGGTTSVSGTVYDPADNDPLYNVAVYVPNAPLAQIVHGATCDQCGSALSGDPLVATLTDASGHFKLDNVPVATNVPLVFQVGKWRRRITLPAITQCADNPIADKTLTRLATKPGETSPDDDIPFIALTTGGADPFECLPLKIGIDRGQFTNQGSGGRVNLYQGAGGSALAGGSPSAAGFWSDEGQLKSYDIVMMGCEGDTHPEEKPQAALQAMFDYGNAGGRVFGTHYHYYWIESGVSPWPTTATFAHHDTNSTPQSNWDVLIDQSFPKGQAFAQWMVNVGASTTLGQFPLDSSRWDVDLVNTQPANAPTSSRWVYQTYQSSEVDEYYSFNTPVNVDPSMQCGKVVFSDLHVASADQTGGTFPNNCTTKTMSAQEKALEFLLFDLSSCVQNDSQPPAPPVH